MTKMYQCCIFKSVFLGLAVFFFGRTELNLPKSVFKPTLVAFVVIVLPLVLTISAIAELLKMLATKILRMQLREQSIPRLGRRSKAYYGVRLERELLAAFDSCPERNFIALNDQNEVVWSFGRNGEWLKMVFIFIFFREGFGGGFFDDLETVFQNMWNFWFVLI